MDSPDPPFAITLEVRDTCLCLHSQRAARAIARVFDDAFRHLGLTNGQFSLMMALNRPEPPRMTDLVPLLGMDRTTLTAALKPLEARALVTVAPDPKDRRSRRLSLTEAGRAMLASALPVWRATHHGIETRLGGMDPASLRAGLDAVAGRGAV
ncbi:MarR family winged helix-turn-helix transcriptional regulator [Roseicyclus mahoneyensis]|uniref:MarR family transcriptional regulator n=1 Tax=Roseicyclus mahoneyensis TaxID=164332 RepID=A0A316GQS2_9RHOB|nr:MarR family winged helix-turn-helix transcriptional regulator [Roseicyclus mahoneyensis]PWK62751.1 MarR family transcriptional regulator [Roseicyclus mahoneyensis]